MFIVNSEPTEITYSLLGCMLITESDDTTNLGYAMSFTVNILADYKGIVNYLYLIKLRGIWICYLINYKGIANYLYII